MLGKCKWFSNKRSYGFLVSEGVEGDIFVWYASIQMEGFKKLKENQMVEFELVETEKGNQAINVKPCPVQ